MNSKIVVCLGASMVRGQFSASFVDMLKQRMGKDGFRFVNQGVNGDLAYNILNRLEPVLAQNPNYIVILVGTNDVTSAFSPKIGESVRSMKKLPQLPSIEWYRDNIQAIVQHLKTNSAAKIGLCSLPNLGENLESPLNLLLNQYNIILKETAEKAQITYLPVNKRQTSYLRQHQTQAGRELTAEMFTPMTLRLMFYRTLLRLSFDRIARMNKFLLTAEGIHMNSVGAALIADEIETFLQRR